MRGMNLSCARGSMPTIARPSSAGSSIIIPEETRRSIENSFDVRSNSIYSISEARIPNSGEKEHAEPMLAVLAIVE